MATKTDKIVSSAIKAAEDLHEEQFPTIFTDGRIRIYKNPTNEIFMKHLKTGVTIRFYDSSDGIGFTTQHAIVEPQRVSNIIGWLIRKRR